MKKIALLIGFAFSVTALSGFADGPNSQVDCPTADVQTSFSQLGYDETFCNCFKAKAQANCAVLQGHPCNLATIQLFTQESEQIQRVHSLTNFCSGDIVKNKLHIPAQVCLDDNGKMFTQSGSLMHPNPCDK